MAKKATAAKTETKAAATKAEAEVKTETKAPAKATKTAAKTTRAAKAKEAAVTVEIQFGGKNTVVDTVVEAVKAAYKADGNTDAIESIKIYVQPENGVAYYVVNDKEEGKSVEL